MVGTQSLMIADGKTYSQKLDGKDARLVAGCKKLRLALSGDAPAGFGRKKLKYPGSGYY